MYFHLLDNPFVFFKDNKCACFLCFYLKIEEKERKEEEMKSRRGRGKKEKLFTRPTF